MRNITLILLIGAALRIHALGQDIRFHPDEALYATYARSAVVHGDWKLSGPLDKPPLSIYLSAISMHFIATSPFGNYHMDIRTGEFAARLPNVFGGILLIALTYTLSQSILKRAQSTYVASFLVALSPYMIVFNASAFTDTLMLTFMVSALLMAVRGRIAWSGLLIALSIATKPQGMFYIPLTLGILWVDNDLSRNNVVKFATTFAIGITSLYIWDKARTEPSVFTLAQANYPTDYFVTPIRLWTERLLRWLRYAGWLVGPPSMTWGLVGCGLWHGRDDLRTHIQTTLRKMGGSQIAPTIYSSHLLIDYAKRCPVIAVIWFYIITLITFHTIFGVHIYDRYLLPLVPLLAIIIGQWFRLNKPFTIAFVLITIITAFQISEWQIDLGRDHYPVDREGEIIQLANHLNAKSLGTIIYDPWLGWEMGYYLGVWSDKRHVNYPNVNALITDALCNPDLAPRYIIAPSYGMKDPQSWINTISENNFTVSLDLQLSSFVIYKLLPPPSVKEC